eukprot:TRINITY_DN11476_c0_g1_i1.p1 TRINITY_DN11476_c0_g1~~TRINITY_DN11476_c0_g1_i1.p1  ORF type:complete len:108 (-),score=33.34 TRINITY_DN11476_c0_g1_i1:37-360(-)
MKSIFEGTFLREEKSERCTIKEKMEFLSDDVKWMRICKEKENIITNEMRGKYKVDLNNKIQLYFNYEVNWDDNQRDNYERVISIFKEISLENNIKIFCDGKVYIKKN